MNCCINPYRHLLPVLVLTLCSLTAWSQQTPGQNSGQAPGQDSGQAPGQDSGQAPAGTGSDTGAPPAATGPAEQNLENPPVTGLDRPLTEALYGGRSYLLPGLEGSESVTTNVGARNTGASAATQGLGSLDLQRFWKRYAVGLDYVGGGTVYTGPTAAGQGRAYQVHTLASDQRFLWRTGQLAIRDTFDYLPEGTFGFGSFGGAGGFGSALGGVGSGTGLGGGLTGSTPNGAFNGTGIGSVGIEPRIDNLSIVDVTQELSARSTVTLAGGFGLSDYINKPKEFVNSEETTAQAGYSRQLTRSDQIGLLYGFQELHFPKAGSGSVDVQMWNLMYAHRITGRLNFAVGGGPQLVEVHNPAVTLLLFGIIPVQIPASTTKSLTASAMATVGYTVSSRTGVTAQYQRFVSTGSGFFAGANTNAVRFSASHVFGQRWTGSVDVGYSRNSSLSNSTPNSGINAGNYQFWYAGGSVQRQLSQHFGVFASYQFNDFGSSGCVATNGSHAFCNSTSHRQTGQIGIAWHPSPIRLD